MPAMNPTSLNDLYVQKLQLLLDSEQQIVAALPQLAQAAKHDELRNALQQHLGETKTHVQRVQSLVQRRSQGAERKPCDSMRALIQETQSTLPSIQDPDTIDAFIIGAAQAVEHHEITAYGTARSWASQLGFNDDADTLQMTLDEEGKADHTLTSIAEDTVNAHAMHR